MASRDPHARSTHGLRAEARTAGSPRPVFDLSEVDRTSADLVSRSDLLAEVLRLARASVCDMFGGAPVQVFLSRRDPLGQFLGDVEPDEDDLLFLAVVIEGRVRSAYGFYGPTSVIDDSLHLIDRLQEHAMEYTKSDVPVCPAHKIHSLKPVGIRMSVERECPTDVDLHYPLGEINV